MTRALVVERTGPLVTVQDAGRVGLAHLGVPRSGAADRAALAHRPADQKQSWTARSYRARRRTGSLQPPLPPPLWVAGEGLLSGGSVPSSSASRY